MHSLPCISNALQGWRWPVQHPPASIHHLGIWPHFSHQVRMSPWIIIPQNTPHCLHGGFKWTFWSCSRCSSTSSSRGSSINTTKREIITVESSNEWVPDLICEIAQCLRTIRLPVPSDVLSLVQGWKQLDSVLHQKHQVLWSINHSITW